MRIDALHPISGSRTDLLTALRGFTLEATKDMLLPVRIQREGETPELRPPACFLMYVPDGTHADKKAPYVLHQLLVAHDGQQPGERETSTAQVRTIFCVYSPDDEEGGLMLAELIERFRIPLLRQVVLEGRFKLSLQTPMEALYYPSKSAPYFIGECVSTWELPAIEREVRKWL